MLEYIARKFIMYLDAILSYDYAYMSIHMSYIFSCLLHVGLKKKKMLSHTIAIAAYNLNVIFNILFSSPHKTGVSHCCALNFI